MMFCFRWLLTRKWVIIIIFSCWMQGWGGEEWGESKRMCMCIWYQWAMKKSKDYYKQMLALTTKTMKSDLVWPESVILHNTIIRNIIIRFSDNPYKEILRCHIVDHRAIYLVCKNKSCLLMIGVVSHAMTSRMPALYWHMMDMWRIMISWWYVLYWGFAKLGGWRRKKETNDETKGAGSMEVIYCALFGGFSLQIHLHLYITQQERCRVVVCFK